MNINRKQKIITLVSSSALASGLSQGAVLYSGPITNTISASTGAQSFTFDLNQDSIPDFTLGFDFNDSTKPYLQGDPNNTPGATPLALLASDGDYGLPVTQFGTTIDGSYLTPVPSSSANDTAWPYKDTVGPNVIGSWTNNFTEGYVALEMYDNSGDTNYGWAHLILNQAAKTLTLVDYAYETTTNMSILAGETNEVGAPDIYVEPQAQTNGVGSTVQLSVVALANPAPIYQWLEGPASGSGPYTNISDGGVIAGSSTSNLTLTGATAAYDADYEVIITNSLGSVTSTPVTLTLVSPTVTPTGPVVLFGGVTAVFNVSGTATSYQWQHNGVNLANGGRISGAQTSALTIANLQTTDAGGYDAVVNVGTPVTSTVSSLTVLPVSSASTYEAAVLEDSPVAFYRFNETGNPATNNLVALDNVGAFNGIYGVDVTNAFEDVTGPDPTNGFPGFASNNAAALFSPDDTNSQITVQPWNLNTNTVTFTYWVNPPAQQNYSAAVLWSGTNSGDYAGINYYYDGGTGAGAPGDIDLGYTWNEGTSPAYEFWDSGIMPPLGQWSMVALVIVPSSVTLYVMDSDSTNINNFPGDNSIFPFTNAVMAFNTVETIGNNPTVGSGAQGFNGAIADMAVFNQALTQNQIQTLYGAALGVLPPPPNPNISLVGTNVQVTWPIGSLLQATNLLGPWTTNLSAISPYTVNPSNSAEFYQIVW